ncbi:uncharacterized protein LOC133301147 [Gastrolobium bilobum]|uniref:uncharacterized protein LOC133301147 n=1 Tax=Gastrolobium bilobum TaxID=150636 RepID=UPI002AB2119F|nr:uncharacterized protein LOC133301147 [Gastrolobium bilobum]
MMKSQLHQQYQASYYEAYGFDLREDFSQYLEEAKSHVNEAKRTSSSVHPEESGITGSKKEKKVKKSWKSSLISWWKGDKNKKSKLRGEPTNNSKSKVSGQRKGHVSGPIYNSAEGIDVKHRGSTSGPLTSLFKSTKREECEIPYMSLHQQTSPRPVHNYGPLYVVT